MLRRFRKLMPDPIDNQIHRIFMRMHQADVNSEEYLTMMTHLERLYDLKAKDRRKVVSRDTMMIVAGNLLGILLIVVYEEKHVLTSKGLNQILRPKHTNLT